MPFTKIGRLVAWLALCLGLILAVWMFALELGAEQTALTSGLTPQNISKLLHQALTMMTVGIALGILTEISDSLARRTS